VTARSSDPRTDVVQIPTPLALAESQHVEAVQLSRIDYSTLPNVCDFPTLHATVGPFLPGDLWVVGARPGNGKTTLLLNLFDVLMERGFPTIYLTTEIKAAQMRRVWAAMRLGYPTRDVLENAWHRLPAGAREAIDESIKWQCLNADIGLFVDLPYLNSKTVGDALKAYAIRDRYVIVDHINRWLPRDNAQKTAEMTQAVQAFKAVAMEHNLNPIIAAQVNRPQGERSPLADFQPPPISALKQTGSLEEEASVILMLHRARKADATPAMVKEVALGQREVKDLLEPDVMCVSVGKHRVRGGEATGRIVRFRIQTGGRLTDEALVQPSFHFPLAAALPPGREPGDEPEQESIPF